MLLYFSVANFRSIRSELTLSMSGGRFKSSIEHRGFETGFAQIPCALRAAAVYGANASGKSTLVQAFDVFQDFVKDSFRNEAGSLLSRVKPYRYSEDSPEGATNFEVCFVSDDIMYTFGFSVTRDRVCEEWLHAKTKGGRVREVYSRLYSDNGYEWHFSPFFTSKRRCSTWKEATRADALFLSTAIHLNSEELIPVHRWITHKLKIVTSTDNLGHVATSRYLEKHENRKADIISLLKSADPTVMDIELRTKPLDEMEAFSFFSEDFRRELLEVNKENKAYEVTLHHVNGSGDRATFTLDEESDGTRSMFKFAAPVISSIRNDYTLVVDEFDRSLHPILLQSLLSSFASPTEASTRAQIIFTTHDTALLSSDLLAPDQIWFAENVNGEGTVIIPLADYKPRRGEAVQRAYLKGRYGGVPFSRARMISHAE